MLLRPVGAMFTGFITKHLNRKVILFSLTRKLIDLLLGHTIIGVFASRCMFCIPFKFIMRNNNEGPATTTRTKRGGKAKSASESASKRPPPPASTADAATSNNKNNKTL
jgi:hypothetical protein